MSAKIHPYYFQFRKRVFDLFFSCIFLTIFSPIIISISLVTLLINGRPILFRQKRFGLGGRIFTINKFRTMYDGADSDQKKYSNLNAAPSPMFKIKNDPRFIKMGKFLSQTGLDELPQLINIIRGEMSLIGPRPLPVHEAIQLDDSWNYRKIVRPGLFSEWTISDKRHNSLHTWKQLEKKTLKHGSMTNDLSIIVRTILKIIPCRFS